MPVGNATMPIPLEEVFVTTWPALWSATPHPAASISNQAPTARSFEGDDGAEAPLDNQPMRDERGSNISTTAGTSSPIAQDDEISDKTVLPPRIHGSASGALTISTISITAGTSSPTAQDDEIS